MSPTTTARSLTLFSASGLLLVAGLIVPAGAGQRPKPTEGELLFRDKCAPCHGAKGEGGPGFRKPLTGTQSVAELSQFIHQSMPPGKKTPAPQAAKVAAYIHNAFYSPLAQERNRPARVELSRLTVRQFRNAVADLVGTYHPAVPGEEARGLKGEYFKGRDRDAKARAFERIDPEVRFDFGTEGPKPGEFDPHTFSAVWQGSVLAPDTGEYEFVVQTDHAARLWVNGEKQPLVDAWVKSGSDTEFRSTITLLGGRAYPLRLEFSKASYGVNDDDKKKGKPAPRAFVSLLWKRPKRAMEPIPARCLFPQSVPTTFVVTSPFPPDDRSIGYERGSTVSKEWAEATTAAALETAGYVAENLATLSGVPDDAPDRKARLQTFCRQFVERAFRRPLSKETERTYVDGQFATAPNLETAVKRVVVLTLKSPRFLYREIGSREKDGYLAASQLSFGLWDSLPDPELQRAAATGELMTRAGVVKQAERLANDPRAWNKLHEFLLHWLKVDEVPDLVKSNKRYPGFDAATASDLRTSLELYLESTAGSQSSDFRELMLGKTYFLNGRLAKLYGAKLPPDAPFQPVALDPEERAGVLTHPYLLSRFAYLETSSPIHRGVLVARSMLGRTLRPPPAAFTPLAPSLHPSLTTRQRVALQTKPNACNSCHSMINPLGFSLERFDAIGRLRDRENGKPVDATGSYLSRSGKLVKFAGATDLSRYLASSDESRAAFVEKLFTHLVKQPTLAYSPKTLPSLQQSFADNRYSIRKLMVQIMAATTLPEEKPAPPKGGRKE
jgi:hypothetical protein